MMRRPLTLLAVGLVLAAGCASRRELQPRSAPPPPEQEPAAPERAAPAESEAAPAFEADDRTEEKSEPSRQYAEPPPPAASPEPAGSPPEAAGAPGPMLDDEALLVAQGELERAEALVSAGLRDCARACRALDSMDRARAHICELEPPPGGGRCAEARRRVTRAAERVRQGCGACRGER